MATLWMMMIWSARRRERHLQECRIIPHSQTDSLHTQSIIIVIIIIIIKIIFNVMNKNYYYSVFALSAQQYHHHH